MTWDDVDIGFVTLLRMKMTLPEWTDLFIYKWLLTGGVSDRRSLHSYLNGLVRDSHLSRQQNDRIYSVIK